MQIENQVHEAYEVLVESSAPAPVLITCEHASNRLPAPWNWSAKDHRLSTEHWAYDPGAEALTRELVKALNGVGVMSRFSRLLIDPNRGLTQENLFREVADSEPVELNQDLSEEERQTRIENYWRPFHDTIDGVAEILKPQFLLSVHSFTPLYEGSPRSVEMGVLHDVPWPELAQEWHGFLRENSEMDVRVNEPYTGVGGYMYSATVHAAKANCPTLEMEFRQDIITDPARRPELVKLMVDAIASTLA